MPATPHVGGRDPSQAPRHLVPMTGPSPAGRGQVLRSMELFLGLWPRPVGEQAAWIQTLPSQNPLLGLGLCRGFSLLPGSRGLPQRHFCPWTDAALLLGVGECLMRPPCWHHPRILIHTLVSGPSHHPGSSYLITLQVCLRTMTTSRPLEDTHIYPHTPQNQTFPKSIQCCSQIPQRDRWWVSHLPSSCRFLVHIRVAVPIPRVSRAGGERTFVSR